MNIDKFKEQHIDILNSIVEMRRLVKDGIPQNASAISHLVIRISGLIKLHLAREDSHLYPALKLSGERLAEIGQRYQDEMGGIANAYMAFSRKWNTPREVHSDPEGFRLEANGIFKALHQRIQRENVELYPLIENQV